MAISNSEKLRQLLKQSEIISAPGVYDGFSGKLIEKLGFKVAYASGGMISAGLLGKPDVGLVSMAEMVTQVKYIANAIDIPVISDADTGYGNAMNVMRTVREFELTGVAGIHLEDQELPKRCGHLSGKRIIPKSEMVDKVRAAVDARRNESFVIIARTDARGVNGLDDAMERGHAYVEAGADMLFIEAPESVDELKIIGSTFTNVPLMVVMGGRKTPYVPNTQLQNLGFKVVLYPGELQRITAKAVLDTMKVFKETGDATVIGNKQITFDEHFELLGINEHFATESKYMTSE